MQKQKVLEKTGLSDKGSVIFFGVVCWVTYFSIYLGRLNFSASMSEMAQTGIWGKTQLGSVAAAFYLAYGLGQFPSGVLGDHFSGRKLVMLGLVGAALANAAFPCRKYQRNAGDLVYQRTLSGTCMAADGETGCRYDTWKTDSIDCPGVIIYQPGRDAECVSVQCGYVREKGMAV